MNKNFTLFALAIIATLTSCHRYYTSSRFDEKASKHKIVAILPPRMILTGNQPRSYSQREIDQLEIQESKLFQETLLNNILKYGNQGKYQLDVDVQAATTTVALLAKNNVSVRQSWELDDIELEKLLGVDAVVRTSIQKDRIMSDVASAGAYAGKKIVDAIVKDPTVSTGTVIKTNDIIATCSVLSNGETLWNDSYKAESNFRNSANDMIEHITGSFAKHFPYRRKA